MIFFSIAMRFPVFPFAFVAEFTVFVIFFSVAMVFAI
jgi:hypothetical protein